MLGPFVVVRAGQPLPFGRSKLRDLLALLAAHAPEAVSADSIVDELWQGSAPPTARKIVQKHISELRQLLGRPHVVSLAGGYALRDVGLDSAIFDMAVEQARSQEPRIVCERLADALAMWRGEPYADVDLDGLEPLRARLGELRLAAIEQLNEARLSLGAFMPLIADLERLTIEHPLREGLWSQLMRALNTAGRQSEALRAFQRLRAGLARELGIEPSGELRQLEQRILAQDPDLGAASTSVADIDPGDAHRRVMTIIAVELDDAAGDDPEDRARSMKTIHEQIHEWCDLADGSIESSMGSRLLITFGAPAHEDDADRAVHLANHLVAQLPTARASLATGWALIQPGLAPGAHIVGSVVEVACSGLSSTPRGTAHVDHSTTAARSRPIEDPPFVGREHELAIAGELLSRTRSGRGPQAISVRGEPGVGKTRLVRELRRRSPDALTWLHVRCADRASPSAPLGAIIREHIALADSATESEWFAGFEALLETLLPEPGEREWLRRRLGPAAGLGEPSMAERSEIVAAWVTYFAATARHGPTVIVLDDVHRADPAFDALLTDCFTQLRDVPLLVLSTARPEHPERALQFVGTDNLTLTLRGLDESEIDVLLDHLLADDPVTEAQHVLVRARSSGNPLYAIQFARMLRQQGWSGSIPHSTRSLISARLDLLAPLERAMLLAGAVADQPFGAAQLAAMQGVDPASAGLALRHLVDKALLNATTRDELSFTHDLVREVAYEHLSRSGRARLHEAAATWMEQRAGDRLADDAMRIASQLTASANAHEEDGEDAAAADQRAHVFRLMLKAGDRLRGLGVEDTASRLAEAVQADHATADLAELQRQRAMALARVGRLTEAGDAARMGLEAARQVDDRPLQARLNAVVGEVHWLRGDTASCMGALEEAMALVDDLPMDRAATEALASLAFITALLGRPAEAIALAERGLILARDHGLADREVRCLNARGAAVLLQGNLEGYNDFVRALTRALEAGLGHESAMAYHNLAELQLQGVGTATSSEMNARGLDLAERRGLTLAADWLRANRVQLFFEAGRWDEALDIAGEVIASEARSGHGQAGTMCAVWAARIHVWRGELDHASELMDTFLPRARQHAVIQQIGPALIVAGLLATGSGRPERGAAYAVEYCMLTEATRAYRHMELADVVRLLVAASRADRASAAADSAVIPTFRNECESRTAEATLARARGDANAVETFYLAAELWGAFGHPLEEHLALRSALRSAVGSAAALRPDSGAIARAEQLAASLRLGSETVATLCGHDAARSA